MNSVNISGRLTRDAELRENAKTAVVNVTVAVDSYNSETKEKSAEFIPVVVFGKQAEFLASYGTKGREISVSGRLQVRKWEDREGNKRTSTEVIADRVELHGPKTEKKAAPQEEEDFSFFN